jgi:hypothetical protein
MNNTEHLSEIGLRVIASETSFIINLGSDFIINQNELLGKEIFLQALYNLLKCFATETVGSDGISNLTINNLLRYDNSIKSKLEEFVTMYKSSQLQLNRLEKNIQKIKIDEYICVLLSSISLSTEEVWNIYQELDKLNGKDKQISIPLLKEYNMYSYGEKSHTNIGHQDKNLRKCRWCGKTMEMGATFNKKAHAITEALGNKNVILLDECDSCNEKFGKTIEQSIVAQFSLFNTIFGIRGKRGVSKLKDINTQSSIEHTKEKELTFRVHGNIMNFDGEDPIGMTLTLANNYIAQNVCKSLCKYALSVVEDESILSEFSDTIKWLNGEVIWSKVPIIKVLNTYEFFSEHPTINIYIRKTDNIKYPRMFAEFRHTNSVMVYIIPTSKQENDMFTNSSIFKNFWDLSFFNNIDNWIDWDFSNGNEKELQFNLNFKKY